MKYFAQFYVVQGTTPHQVFYTEPCGDRQMIQLDGRLKHGRMREIAAQECSKRGYAGFRLFKADNLLDPVFIDSFVRTVA